MYQIEQSWPADACDAVSIGAPGVDITIEGSDSDRITLEGDLPGTSHNNRIEQVERWLLINLQEAPSDDVNLILRLPRHKRWTVQLSSRLGDVRVLNIDARLQIILQRGDIQVDNCRGIFALAASAGNIELASCCETEIPEPPAAAPQMQAPQLIPPIPPIPPLSPILSGNWPSQPVENLTRWAQETSKWASAFAQEFAQEMTNAFHPSDWQMPHSGIDVQMGHGDVHIENVEARACAIRVSKGDTTIEGGWVAGLHVHSGRGDVECEAVLPGGEWTIQTAHGDISLSLPANTQARLDVATSHGDIHSAAALVRVSRPGPEARYGRRMVGSVGRSDGDGAQISLEAIHGDITIEMEATPSTVTGQSAAARTDRESQAPLSAQDSVDQPGHTITTDTPEQPYASQMAILQALSDKHITAEEAERLLLSLGV